MLIVTTKSNGIEWVRERKASDSGASSTMQQ